MRRISIMLVLSVLVGACRSDSTPGAPTPTPVVGQLAGSILDTDDQPLAGAVVRASVNGYPELRETDAAGKFSFDFNGPDRLFELRIEKQGYLLRQVNVSSSTAPLIRLQRRQSIGFGDRLEGILRDTDPDLVVAAPGGSISCKPCQQFSLNIGPLPQGNVRIRLRSSIPTSNPLSLWVTGVDDNYETTVLATVPSAADAEGHRVAEVVLKARDAYPGGVLVGYDANAKVGTELGFELSLSAVN